MLSSATTNLITDAINNARSQVCQAINDQVEGVVGNARGTVSDFNSGLSDELRGVLDNGWDLTL